MRDNRHPLEIVREAARAGVREVAVGVSGGMDSVVALDLAVRHFPTVRPYFCYIVRDISFQEQYLQFLERRFGVTIDRMPHWLLGNMLRQGTMRHQTEATANLRRCRIHHFMAYVRKRLKTHWLLTGEKASDSLERNAMMVRDGAFQPARGRIYPLAWWSQHDVQAHLARNQIPLPPDYRLNAELDPALRRRRGASFGGLIVMAEIVKIAEKFPEDYQKIQRVFPFVDVQLQRWRQLNERGLVQARTSKIKRPRGTDADQTQAQAKPTSQPSSSQPATDQPAR